MHMIDKVPTVRVRQENGDIFASPIAKSYYPSKLQNNIRSTSFR